MKPERLLTQGEIEHHIVALSQSIEDETYRYAELGDVAAEAEADYKLKQARMFIVIAENQSKMTVQERQARVDLHANDEFRTWKVQEARRQASKESLLSLRARLDAMRTLSASLRHQT